MARKQPRALVAAATRLRIERTLTGQIPTETWQQAMWGIYDETPEVHYGLNFKRGAASRVRFFAAQESDDPEAEPEPTDNQQVIEAVEALNRGQGLSEMIGESLIHLDVAGEGYIVGSLIDDLEDDPEQAGEVIGDKIPYDQLSWYSYSASELSTDKWKDRLRNNQALPYRVWRPHPLNGNKPDSPLHATAKVASELWDLSSLGQAQARSRIPAKILVLNQSMLLAQDEQANPNDSIADRLGQQLIRPITDPGSAASVVPIIIEAPEGMVGQGQGWDLIDLARDVSEISEREERLIRRLAAGLDLPPEIILGMADINHWGAWLIDEQAVKTHVDPPVRLVTDSLSRAYLRTVLVEQGMGRDEASEYLIWRDLSHLVQHQDRSSAARDLFRLGAVGFESLRQANGFGPDDAPSIDELELMGWLLGRGNPSTGQVIDIPGRGGTDTAPAPEEVQPGPPEGAITAAAGSVTLDGLADVDQLTLDLLTEAVEAAVQKAMERAGARLRNQTRRDKVMSDQIAGTDNRIVAMLLTQRVALQLVPENELLSEDDFVQLGEQASRILGRAQVSASVEIERLGAVAADVDVRKGWLTRAVETLVRTTIGLTLRRLFTPTPDPDPVETGETGDVAVPAADVWNVMTIAGGGEPGTFQPDQPRGVALGPDVRSRLAEAGYQTEAYEWRYGDAPRRTNFPPHLALSGARFTSWTDDRLQSYTSWLAVTHYYPGDHRGCRCVAVPVVELEG